MQTFTVESAAPSTPRGPGGRREGTAHTAIGLTEDAAVSLDAAGSSAPGQM